MALSVPTGWFGQNVILSRTTEPNEVSFSVSGVLARDSFGPYVHVGGRKPEFEILAGDFLELVDTDT